MHHAYATRFDMTGNLKNFWELNKALKEKIEKFSDFSSHQFCGICMEH
jgi:hypothetical protein